MTHAKLFEDHPTPGFEQPACTGALEPVWSRTEQVWHNGAFRAHAIELFKCAACGTFVPFDASAGRVVNAYQAPPVTQLARELARAFDAGRE